MVLIVLVVRNVVQLYSSARSPSGKGRLQLRLIRAFVMIALLPTLGLFAVASGLIDKSFNTFFNPKVENNLPCIELEHLSQGTGTILGTTDSKNQKSTKNDQISEFCLTFYLKLENICSRDNYMKIDRN